MIVIIYANPSLEGHCGHIKQEIELQLKEKGQAYTMIDLYKGKFDPVLKKEEHYTSGGFMKAEATQKYIELLSSADKHIYVYPIWWNTMPAILKGFFDKVFVSRVAFEYVKYPWLWFAVPRALWTKKKATVFVTTGASWWQSLFFLGDRFATIVRNDILGFCGIRARVWRLDSASKYTTEKQPHIKAMVKRGLSWLLK